MAACGEVGSSGRGCSWLRPGSEHWTWLLAVMGRQETLDMDFRCGGEGGGGGGEGREGREGGEDNSLKIEQPSPDRREKNFVADDKPG